MSQKGNEYLNQVFFDACRVIEQKINAGSFCIVAIGGAMGGGKTLLSRYLSWKLRLPSLETDLFLRLIGSKVSYDCKYIQEILEREKINKRNIIVEGCSILPVLGKFDPSEIFLVHIENKILSGHPPIELIDWKNTEHCSINEILEIDLQADLKNLAQHTIRWAAH